MVKDSNKVKNYFYFKVGKNYFKMRQGLYQSEVNTSQWDITYNIKFNAIL